MSSFNNLKVDTLRAIADNYGVDVAPEAGKAEIIAALKEDGIDYNTVSVQHPTLAPAAAPKLNNSPVVEKVEDDAQAEVEHLVKMISANGTFEVRGYRFTRNYPILVVKQSDANAILSMYPESFRIATPAEAEEFYS